MRWLSKLAALLTILSLGTLLASVPVLGSYTGRAVLAQRVEVDTAGASLFGGDAGTTPIGSPQRLIVEDSKAFLADNDGVKQLDEGYLKKNQIYPLQLKTVEYIVGLVRAGAAAALVLGLILLFFARKRPTTVSP